MEKYFRKPNRAPLPIKALLFGGVAVAHILGQANEEKPTMSYRHASPASTAPTATTPEFNIEAPSPAETGGEIANIFQPPDPSQEFQLPGVNNLPEGTSLDRLPRN